MGIDRERLATKTYSRQHNVKLMLGDATARLAKLPKESVKIINMIFFRLFQLKEILKCLE
jgi:hypothetical protein